MYVYATLKLTNICKQCYESYWCTLGVAHTLSGSLFLNCSYHCFHIEEKSEKRRSTADTDVLVYLEAKHESQVRLRERELDIKETELELQTARFKLEKEDRETRLKHETTERMAILPFRMDLKK